MTITAINAHANHGRTDFLIPTTPPQSTLGSGLSKPYGPSAVKSTDLGLQGDKTAVASISTFACGLDQRDDLDHRHRREVAAHDVAVGGADLLLVRRGSPRGR